MVQDMTTKLQWWRVKGKNDTWIWTCDGSGGRLWDTQMGQVDMKGHLHKVPFCFMDTYW